MQSLFPTHKIGLLVSLTDDQVTDHLVLLGRDWQYENFAANTVCKMEGDEVRRLVGLTRLE